MKGKRISLCGIKQPFSLKANKLFVIRAFFSIDLLIFLTYIVCVKPTEKQREISKKISKIESKIREEKSEAINLIEAKWSKETKLLEEQCRSLCGHVWIAVPWQNDGSQMRKGNRSYSCRFCKKRTVFNMIEQAKNEITDLSKKQSIVFDQVWQQIDQSRYKFSGDKLNNFLFDYLYNSEKFDGTFEEYLNLF